MSTSWCLRQVGPNPTSVSGLCQWWCCRWEGDRAARCDRSRTRCPPPAAPTIPPPASRVRAHGADAHGAAPLWRCNSHISSVCNVQSAAFSTVTGSPTHPVQSRASRHPRRKPRPHQQSLPTPSPAPDTHSLSSCPRGRPVLDTSRPWGPVPCGRVCARRPSSRGPCRCLPPSVAAGPPRAGGHRAPVSAPASEHLSSPHSGCSERVGRGGVDGFLPSFRVGVTTA